MKEFLTSGWIIRVAPGHWHLGWGTWTPTVDAPLEGAALYAPDFFLKNPGWIQTTLDAEMSSDELRTLILPHLGVRLDPIPWKEPSRREFDSSFAAIQSAISSGELAKAVPVVFAQRDQSLTLSARCALILALLELPETLNGYGVWSMREGIIGATPEVLFEVRGAQLTAMALAGTLRKPATAADLSEFLQNKKERFEHQLVIDSIRASLSNFGEVQVGETRTVELPQLFHLRTDISARLKTSMTDIAAFVAALHPTPALGTSPREKFHWLEQLPSADRRGRFGAPFVFRGETGGSALALVAIRCLQWDEHGQRIGSGCGIVAASDADNEWKELSAKRQSVRAALDV